MADSTDPTTPGPHSTFPELVAYAVKRGMSVTDERKLCKETGISLIQAKYVLREAEDIHAANLKRSKEIKAYGRRARTNPKKAP